MKEDNFKTSLEATFGEFFALVSTENGDWIAKGIIHE
jgi:hypothetical protein